MKQNLFVLTLVFSVLLMMNGCKKPKTDIVYNKKYVKEIKDARKKVKFHMIQNFIPGANIAVSINGELVYSEGIGLASRDLDAPAGRNTKFRIGEVSTLYTNALYQKLVEEGKIYPDSSIQHYIPTFPVKVEGKISLKMLANEISGIQPPLDGGEMRLVNKSIEDGIQLFKDEALEMPPGMFQAQSCYNYNLLGVAMEKATGKKYSQLLKEYVTDTLHMDNTVIDNPFAMIKGRSNFYEPNILAQVVNTTFYDLRATAPSKGLLSNAEDLVKLGNACLSGDFFSEETRKNLFEPLILFNNNTSRMVNGWFVFKDPYGRTVYGLEGSVVGGSASVIILPESKVVVAWACNLSTAINDTPVFLVANAFLGAPEGEQQHRSKLK